MVIILAGVNLCVLKDVCSASLAGVNLCELTDVCSASLAGVQGSYRVLKRH